MLVQAGNRIRFVRACVRASGRARRGEAVCPCEELFRPRLGGRRFVCPPGRVAPPQVRWVGVSQSLLVFLDRGMFVGDEKGELGSLG